MIKDRKGRGQPDGQYATLKRKTHRKRYEYDCRKIGFRFPNSQGNNYLIFGSVKKGVG
jgi:hypothetical protein